MLSLPTGTGKGSIASHLALSAAGQGMRTVLTAPRREIILDLRDRMAGQGVEVGILAPWATFNSEAMIQVASDMTLPRQLDQIDEPAFFIPDECHHTVAAGYQPIFETWKRARTVGLTATPWRLDGQGFDHLFDQLLVSEGPRWFMDQGYLVDADIWCPSVPDLAAAGGGRGDFRQVDVEEALERSGIVGDAIQSFVKYVRPGGTAVAFCCSKKHAELTAELFNAAAIPAEVLLGEDSGQVREGKLGRLDSGATQVLCTVDVVSEGFDLPSIDAAILLRPTKSLALYIQQIGRVLRPVFAPGFDLTTQRGRLAAIAAGPKPRAVVLDHAGNVLRHGHPAGTRDWSLKSESQDKRAAVKSEAGEDLSVRQCPECFLVHETALVCPFCGHQHPRDERIPRWKAGELKKMEEEELDRMRKQNRRNQGQARTLEELVKVGRERGVKNPHFWAKKIMQGRAAKRKAA